jgi:hypothetical protein
MVVFGVDAAVQQQCDNGSGVCVAFSIPVTSSTTSDNADIFASVQGPGGLGWVAFGFGQQMSGSLIFVMWENNGQLVVSSRYGTSVPLLSC